MATKRNSSGEKGRVGDKVLAKKAASKLTREGNHANLAREHWTGPWRNIAIEQPGELSSDSVWPPDQGEGSVSS